MHECLLGIILFRKACMGVYSTVSACDIGTVTDVDACALGLDDCPDNSDCESTGPGTFACSCRPGFTGPNCSECASA